MTLAELQIQSAAARARLADARSNLSAATTPARLLDTGFGAVLTGAKALMPEATSRFSQEAGKSIVNMALGSIATFVMSRLTYKKSAAHQKDGAEPNRVYGTERKGEDARATTRASREQSSKGGRMGMLLKTAASGAFALYLGRVISRSVKPTAFEQQLVDRYGSNFSAFFSRTKADLPGMLARSTGLGGKASAALLAISAVAALFKEFVSSGAKRSAA